MRLSSLRNMENKKMELNSNQIQEINPHRYPFALVDRITDYQPGQWAKGIKCVSVNEMHFCGHFPEPQVGCIAILSKEENKGKIAFFGGINKCKFKGQVTPGDVLEMECTLTKQKGPIGIGDAVAKVNGKVVCKAELIFAVQ